LTGCLIFVVCVMLALGGTAAHEAHSPFCESINGTFVDNQSQLRFADATGMGFLVGETLSVEAGGGSALRLQIEVPRGVVVASGTVPGTLNYLVDTVGLTSAAVVAEGGSFSGFVWCYAPDEYAVGQLLTGESPPDSRLNWQYGDELALIYPGSDRAGNPLLRVYGVEAGGQGAYLCTLQQGDTRPRPRRRPDPAEPIKRCGPTVRFYRTAAGDLLAEIGTDGADSYFRLLIDPQTMTVRERL
jgi:hypothetical protein